MSEVKGIKYFGPIFNGSGYGRACRANIMALYKLGVPLTLQPVDFDKADPELGEEGKILASLVDKDIEYDAKILHTTPEFWKDKIENDKINVGVTLWETTRLHPAWKGYINNSKIAGIMVACDWNIEVFKNSGITKPLIAVPYPIPVIEKSSVPKYDIAGLDPNAYVFYFVGQWQERKDPIGLIKAYWRAFQNNENVALVLKTYRSDYSEPEKEAIRTTITRLRSVTIYDRYPKLYFISDLLTGAEIKGVHALGDCYLSLDRGEGFGMSPAEAGAMGNPIIVTRFGGVTEYAKPDNSYLCNYMLDPVGGMPWIGWYRSDQEWAAADVLHGAELLQHVFHNQAEAKEKGLKLQQYIKNNLSEEVIGGKILAAIDQLR